MVSVSGLCLCPRGTGQAPLVFDQQAFTEAVGITATAIAQVGIAGR